MNSQGIIATTDSASYSLQQQQQQTHQDAPPAFPLPHLSLDTIAVYSLKEKFTIGQTLARQGKVISLRVHPIISTDAASSRNHHTEHRLVALVDITKTEDDETKENQQQQQQQQNHTQAAKRLRHFPMLYNQQPFTVEISFFPQQQHQYSSPASCCPPQQHQREDNITYVCCSCRSDDILWCEHCVAVLCHIQEKTNEHYITRGAIASQYQGGISAPSNNAPISTTITTPTTRPVMYVNAQAFQRKVRDLFVRCNNNANNRLMGAMVDVDGNQRRERSLCWWRKHQGVTKILDKVKQIARHRGDFHNALEILFAICFHVVKEYEDHPEYTPYWNYFASLWVELLLGVALTSSNEKLASYKFALKCLLNSNSNDAFNAAFDVCDSGWNSPYFQELFASLSDPQRAQQVVDNAIDSLEAAPPSGGEETSNDERNRYDGVVEQVEAGHEGEEEEQEEEEDYCSTRMEDEAGIYTMSDASPNNARGDASSLSSSASSSCSSSSTSYLLPITDLNASPPRHQQQQQQPSSKRQRYQQQQQQHQSFQRKVALLECENPMVLKTRIEVLSCSGRINEALVLACDLKAYDKVAEILGIYMNKHDDSLKVINMIDNAELALNLSKRMQDRDESVSFLYAMRALTLEKQKMQDVATSLSDKNNHPHRCNEVAQHMLALAAKNFPLQYFHMDQPSAAAAAAAAAATSTTDDFVPTIKSRCTHQQEHCEEEEEEEAENTAVAAATVAPLVEICAKEISRFFLKEDAFSQKAILDRLPAALKAMIMVHVTHLCCLHCLKNPSALISYARTTILEINNNNNNNNKNNNNNSNTDHEFIYHHHPSPRRVTTPAAAGGGVGVGGGSRLSATASSVSSSLVDAASRSRNGMSDLLNARFARQEGQNTLTSFTMTISRSTSTSAQPAPSVNINNNNKSVQMMFRPHAYELALRFGLQAIKLSSFTSDQHAESEFIAEILGKLSFAANRALVDLVARYLTQYLSNYNACLMMISVFEARNEASVVAALRERYNYLKQEKQKELQNLLREKNHINTLLHNLSLLDYAGNQRRLQQQLHKIERDIEEMQKDLNLMNAPPRAGSSDLSPHHIPLPPTGSVSSTTVSPPSSSMHDLSRSV